VVQYVDGQGACATTSWTVARSTRAAPAVTQPYPVCEFLTRVKSALSDRGRK